MTEALRFLRAGDLARALGLTERSIRRHIADGTIPSVKIGGARLVPRSFLDGLGEGPTDLLMQEDSGRNI